MDVKKYLDIWLYNVINCHRIGTRDGLLWTIWKTLRWNFPSLDFDVASVNNRISTFRGNVLSSPSKASRIFWALKMRILPCLDRSESFYPLTECHIPDESYPLLYSCDTLKIPSLEVTKIIWSIWLTEHFSFSDWPCPVELFSHDARSLSRREGQKLEGKQQCRLLS